MQLTPQTPLIYRDTQELNGNFTKIQEDATPYFIPVLRGKICKIICLTLTFFMYLILHLQRVKDLVGSVTVHVIYFCPLLLDHRQCSHCFTVNAPAYPSICLAGNTW